MGHVSYSELRTNLARYMEEVCDRRDALVVTRQKGRSVVMVSEDEYESMQETLHLVRSPANAVDLFRAIKDLDEGRGVEYDPTR